MTTMDVTAPGPEAERPLPHFALDRTGLDARQAFEQWRETVAPVCQAEIAPGETAEGVAVDFETYDLGTMILARTDSRGGQAFERDASTMARSGVDHVVVQAQVSGTSRVACDDRVVDMRPGDVWLLDLGRTVSTNTRDFRSISLGIPRSLIEPQVRDADRLHRLKLAGDSVLGGVLFGHIGKLAACAPRITRGEAAALTSSTLGLIAACVGPSTEAREAEDDAATGITLEALRASIDLWLGDPDLGPELLLRRHGLSRTQLYRLFEPLGGVADYIRRRRLRRCLVDLATPALRERRIAEIASRWGFLNEAAFSRAFRMRFGMTPREVRLAGAADADWGRSLHGGASPLRRWFVDLMAP